MRFFRPSFPSSLLVLGLALGVWVGCDSTGPTGGSTAGPSPVSLSFSAESGDVSGTTRTNARGPGLRRAFSDPSGNSLELETVELILREIEFERAGSTGACASGEEDDCEELESGPILVSLPLDSDQPAVVVDTTLPPGQWEEAEFEVHALDEDDPSDRSILDGTDFPPEASVRAQGTFTPAGGTAQSFTFTSDLNEEREIEFEPPIDVREDEATNVTFSVDVNTWFRQSDGTLVDPNQAGDDGLFEDLVEENIEASIEGFEDNDRDGKEDEDDEGEEDDGDDEDDDGEEDSETEIEVDLNNTGPDADASGEAEFEQESDRTEFKVEVEDLEEGTYEVVVADATRGEIDVTGEDGDAEGEIEFRDPSEPGHPLLDFDPRGEHVAVVQDGVVFLEVDFPADGENDD